MKKIIGVVLAVILCGTAFAGNFVYQGNGTDPNDWFDELNWSDPTGTVTNYPTTADNALFTGANTRMIISDVVPTHAQFQVGRGVPSSAIITEGGVMTNLNQTISGILNNGAGSLVVEGGTLVTKQIQISVAGGTGFVPSEDSNMKIKSGTVHVGLGGGDILLGPTVAGTLELSGGSLTVEDEFKFYRGWLNVIGSDATITISNIFYFGMAASTSTELDFVLGADGSVSKISTDSISFTGYQTLVVDGTFAETDAEQTLVLIELTGSDTFSAAELTLLSDSLDLINMSSGSLSLSGDSKQLIFTGKPVPRALTKAWEFNTIGDTEGWAEASTKTSYVGVAVSNDIDGIETVLTCDDVVAGDGNLYFNEAWNSASFISAGDNSSWRTLEIRLRQLDKNPGEAGVASMQFDPQGTTAVIQPLALIFGKMENINPLCDVQHESNDWVIVTYDISDLGVNDLEYLRFDPIGNDATTNFNFEVDYVRLYAGISQPPIVRKEVAWEFNTFGDTEGWTVNADVTGLTVTNDIDGINSVMTCSSTDGDPQWFYTLGVDGTSGTWDTLEFRARQLLDGTVTNWSGGGTVSVITGVANITPLLDSTDRATQTDETNGWTVIELDISECSVDTISSIRLDFAPAPRTVEIDYIRIYKYERQTPYEFWADQNGLTSANDGPTDDPDSDTFNNLYEYAFGGDPNDDQISGADPFAAGTASVGGTNMLQYVYLKNSNPYNDLTYSLEYTDDLVSGTWSNLTGAVQTGIGTFTSDLDAVTNQVPTDLPAKFIRTVVSQ